MLTHELAIIELSGGGGPENYFFQQIPDPASVRNMNLEGMLSERSMSLYFERFTTSPVRGIRDRARFVEGLVALEAFKLLEMSSQETLRDIWAQYPDSIIEATEFDRPVGAHGQQLVVWEVARLLTSPC